MAAETQTRGQKAIARVVRVAKRTATKARQTVSPRKTAAPVLPTIALLKEIHPDAHCELDHRSPFELLVATVLSAQTTDVNVNKATPKLFARFPSPAALATVTSVDVEPFVATLGFFRQKAKSIVGLAKKIVDEYGGQVPKTLAELVTLPGVGRKTANVILGVAWKTPEGVVVDTHVQRIAQRLGWTKSTDPIQIEQDLMRQVPREDWDAISHLLIFHGRRICSAQKPNCDGCRLNATCPSAFRAENIGRKERRPPPPKDDASATKRGASASASAKAKRANDGRATKKSLRSKLNTR